MYVHIVMLEIGIYISYTFVAKDTVGVYRRSSLADYQP
jgi:hypothetical protein